MFKESFTILHGCFLYIAAREKRYILSLSLVEQRSFKYNYNYFIYSRILIVPIAADKSPEVRDLAAAIN